MCILCGDQLNISLKHLEDITHVLSDKQLMEKIEFLKKHLRNAAHLGAPDEVLQHLRTTLLVVVAELSGRKKYLSLQEENL